MYPETTPVVVNMFPEYASCTNMVLAVLAVLTRFNAAIGTEKFGCVHEEQPTVLDLIERGQAILADHTSDLRALQEWMLDVAIVTPSLWD